MTMTTDELLAKAGRAGLKAALSGDPESGLDLAANARAVLTYLLNEAGHGYEMCVAWGEGQTCCLGKFLGVDK